MTVIAPPVSPPRNLRFTWYLGVITALGPFSFDAYVPAFPAMAADLVATTTQIQLTLTAALVGMAIGQLILGPLSDRYGRRAPLLIALAVYIVVSVACALAPTIEVLIVLRVLQGLSAASGFVIARATVRDYYAGDDLTTAYARLFSVTTIAPVVAPILAGVLLQLWGWQRIFVMLTVFGITCFVLMAITYPRTPTREPGVARVRPPRVRMPATMWLHFIAMIVVLGSATGAVFAYLGESAFIIQEGYGLSSLPYSVLLGFSYVGLLVSTRLAVRIQRRFGPHPSLAGALTLMALAGAGFVTASQFENSLVLTAVSMFLLVTVHGVVSPVAMSLAMGGVTIRAGFAASLIGASQFGIAALAAPIISLLPRGGPLPLGIFVVGAAVLALVAVATATVTGRGPTAPPAPALSPIV